MSTHAKLQIRRAGTADWTDFASLGPADAGDGNCRHQLSIMLDRRDPYLTIGDVLRIVPDPDAQARWTNPITPTRMAR